MSFESILRRKGHVAIAKKRDYWDGKISNRIPTRFVTTLCQLGLLTPRERQVSKKPNVFDASQELLDTIPQIPEGECEGKLISDRPWQPVEIRTVREADAELMGPINPVFAPRLDEITQEVLDLNQCYQDNAHRIEGLDDLRFHRVFHHSLNWGGRLYGQFTHMAREDRANILIDGEPTEEADLSGSYLSFFLLMNGWNELPDDPYQLGALAQYERAFVKEVVLRLFGKGSWWARSYKNALNPIRSHIGYPEALPPYWDFQSAFLRTYPEFAEFNEMKPTFKIEQLESKALLDTLDRIRMTNEIGLPVHDGIRVRSELKDEVQFWFDEIRMQTAQQANR